MDYSNFLIVVGFFVVIAGFEMGGPKRDMDDYVFRTDPLKELLPKTHDAPPHKHVIKSEWELVRRAFGKSKKPYNLK